MSPTQWVDFWLVDAFAQEPFQGNPAGVILDSESFSADRMRLIAREIGAPETAFSLPTKGAADLRLRWFTANCEVPFSGHGTVAALHVLAETGRRSCPAELTIETLSGPLLGWLHETAGECTLAVVQTPIPVFEHSPIEAEALTEALLTSPDSLHPDLPLLKEGMHLFVPLRRLETLLNLYPDFRRLSRLGLEHDITGFACFTTETVDPASHWHMRFFSPGLGVSEDPVTGAAQGPLAVYLLKEGVLTGMPGQANSWIGEQGEALERRGRVQVELILGSRGQVEQVRVGGSAITVMQGRLRVR